MALLTINTVKITNVGTTKRVSNVFFGGALAKPIIRMFKTLTDAVKDGQVGASFFWR